MKEQDVIQHAKQTFIAMQNPYQSVERVYEGAIDYFLKREDVRYVGIKNTFHIPAGLLKKLYRNGGYVLHTLDKMSVSGRAVDLQLHNPISGNYMTGSSSGTAINILSGINELGIGTDGGGSVLAPAMSVQCYGFISPLIERERMESYHRVSTDSLSFSPSIGFITRSLDEMKHAVGCVLPVGDSHDKIRVCIPTDKKIVDHINVNDEISRRIGGLNQLEARQIDFPSFTNSRDEMISFLIKELPLCDCLISYEAKIDVNGLGDSVLGHFDQETSKKQMNSGKYLIRVANMVNATVICVPSKAFASGYVILCESKQEKIDKLLTIASYFEENQDELLERYFRDTASYFPKKFGDDWVEDL